MPAKFTIVIPVLLLIASLTVPKPAAPQEPGGDASTSEELLQLYQADQADRQWTEPPSAAEWEAIAERDRGRRARVLELVRRGAPESNADYYHAAMVLQHGDDPEHFLIAHILASVAGFQGHEQGRWLSAAALDRYLHRTGEPQRFGTQYIRSNRDEPWTQGEYVRWLPDKIREEFGVIPLEAQEDRLRTMNDDTGG